MVGNVSSVRTGGVGAASGVGRGGRATRTGAAMASLAGQVAQRLTREFDLLDDRQPRKPYQPEEDIYEVRATASTLARALGGTAAHEGHLVRSLGLFVTESASLIAARPESRSLQLIEAAIDDGERHSQSLGQGPETAERALTMIDRTTALVAASGAHVRDGR